MVVQVDMYRRVCVRVFSVYEWVEREGIKKESKDQDVYKWTVKEKKKESLFKHKSTKLISPPC